jgi:hypothetical protein
MPSNQGKNRLPPREETAPKPTPETPEEDPVPRALTGDTTGLPNSMGSESGSTTSSVHELGAINPMEGIRVNPIIDPADMVAHDHAKMQVVVHPTVSNTARLKRIEENRSLHKELANRGESHWSRTQTAAPIKDSDVDFRSGPESDKSLRDETEATEVLEAVQGEERAVALAKHAFESAKTGEQAQAAAAVQALRQSGIVLPMGSLPGEQPVELELAIEDGPLAKVQPGKFTYGKIPEKHQAILEGVSRAKLVPEVEEVESEHGLPVYDGPVLVSEPDVKEDSAKRSSVEVKEPSTIEEIIGAAPPATAAAPAPAGAVAMIDNGGKGLSPAVGVALGTGAAALLALGGILAWNKFFKGKGKASKVTVSSSGKSKSKSKTPTVRRHVREWDVPS